jgi:fermentation-respiration switch protein FrsA (DUF1100 family)
MVHDSATPPQRSSRRRVGIALAVLVAACLLVVTGVVLWQAHAAAMEIVHPPRKAVQPRPEDFGLAYEDVSFVTADGLRLQGWYIPPSHPDRAALLVNPGYGDHRGQAITTTAMLARHGYGVLSFDWRAVGESEGDQSTVGYDEVLDVQAAMAWLRARPDVDPDRLGALARSAGAAALIQAAADDPSIRAVVAETTFSTLPDMVAMGVEAKTGLPAFPFAPLIVWFGERETGRHIADVRPVDHIARLSPRPVLLIRAGRDEWVPSFNADRLFAAAGEPKELWDSPNAAHSEVSRDDTAAYEAKVTDFFDRYLRQP